jgi:hypothetical protein
MVNDLRVALGKVARPWRNLIDDYRLSNSVADLDVHFRWVDRWVHCTAAWNQVAVRRWHARVYNCDDGDVRVDKHAGLEGEVELELNLEVANNLEVHSVAHAE